MEGCTCARSGTRHSTRSMVCGCVGVWVGGGRARACGCGYVCVLVWPSLGEKRVVGMGGPEKNRSMVSSELVSFIGVVT